RSRTEGRQREGGGGRGAPAAAPARRPELGVEGGGGKEACRPPSRAGGRRQGGPLGDRRPDARLHSCRGGGTSPEGGRARSLRRGRTRFLVTAADRRPALPAGGDRQPARRRGALRNARITGLRRAPGHA